MTAEDTETLDEETPDEETREVEGSEREEARHEAARDGERPSDDETVAADDDTPGVTGARPGREDIGEAHLPSDYHEAVARRPVEVNLPPTPDLSEDAEDGSTRG